MNTNTNPQWRSLLNNAAQQAQKASQQFQSDYLPKLQRFMGQATEKVGQVDTKLEQTKYGEQYVTLKQEVNSARESYANTKAKIKLGFPETTTEGSAEPYPRAAKVGEAVARTELTLREQLKKALLSVAERL